MDDLIEFLIEIVLEGSHELLKVKKIPKWIRIIIALLFISVIIGIIFLGIILLKESIVVGLITISFGLFLLVGITIKIRKYFNE